MPLYMFSMYFSIVQFHKNPFMNYLFYDNPRGSAFISSVYYLLGDKFTVKY